MFLHPDIYVFLQKIKFILRIINKTSGQRNRTSGVFVSAIGKAEFLSAQQDKRSFRQRNRKSGVFVSAIGKAEFLSAQ